MRRKFSIFNFQFSKAKLFQGFTLIELLVVISIIGILATLLIANIQGARGRARDAQRKHDIREIQNALELYKNSQTPPSYPSASSFSDLITVLQEGGFMKIVPHDPSYPNWTDYYYKRDAEDDLKYTLIACLENASDPQKDQSLASYCLNAGKPASYTRTEP